MANNWTVMVYMAAAGDSKLEAAALRDLKEMERIGSNADVDVVVFVDRDWPGALTYKVGKDACIALDPPGEVPRVNMGKQETLLGFLRAARKAAESPKYCLILWGHAYGLGFGRDHQDPLTILELCAALADFQKDRGGESLDLLAVNACAMSYAEAAFELQDVVQFMASSQISVPYSGLPYQAILRGMRSGNPSAQAVGTLIVDAYVASYSDSHLRDRVAMGLLDLGQAGDLQERLAKLQDGLRDEIDQGVDSDKMAHIRDVFYSTAVGDVRPLIDLQHLCQELKAFTTVGPAAGEFIDFLTRSAQPFIVHHRRDSDLDDVNGVGIFAPFVSESDAKRIGLTNGGSAGTGRRHYALMKIFDRKAGRIEWPTLVYDLLNQDVPEEVLELVESSGAFDRESRVDIAQLTVTMHAVFNTFDRALRACQKNVFTAVEGMWTRPQQAVSDQLNIVSALRELNLLEAIGFSGGGAGGPKQPANGAPAQPGAAAESNAVVATLADAQTLVKAFKPVESALASVEKTTRRILTNARFGLGPPDGKGLGIGANEGKSSGGLGIGANEGKSSGGLGIGANEGKSSGGLGIGANEGKSSGGLGIGANEGKSSGGLGEIKANIAALLATASTDSAFSVLIVVDLFSQVARALQDLEKAVAITERVLALALTDSRYSVELNKSEWLPVSKRHLTRAFKILDEASLTARRTALRVVAHPVYGLGPGPVGFGAADRRELAAAAGFSSADLVLL